MASIFYRFEHLLHIFYGLARSTTSLSVDRALCGCLCRLKVLQPQLLNDSRLEGVPRPFLGLP